MNMHNISKTWSPWWTSFDHTLFTFTGPQYTCTFVRYIPPFARLHTSLAFTFMYTVYGIRAMLAWNSYMHTNTNPHHTAGTYAPWNVQTAGKAKQTWRGLTWSTLMSIFGIMRVWALFFLCVGGFSCALFETKALLLGAVQHWVLEVSAADRHLQTQELQSVSSVSSSPPPPAILMRRVETCGDYRFADIGNSNHFDKLSASHSETVHKFTIVCTRRNCSTRCYCCAVQDGSWQLEGVMNLRI